MLAILVSTPPTGSWTNNATNREGAGVTSHLSRTEIECTLYIHNWQVLLGSAGATYTTHRRIDCLVCTHTNAYTIHYTMAVPAQPVGVLLHSSALSRRWGGESRFAIGYANISAGEMRGGGLFGVCGKEQRVFHLNSPRSVQAHPCDGILKPDGRPATMFAVQRNPRDHMYVVSSREQEVNVDFTTGTDLQLWKVDQVGYTSYLAPYSNSGIGPWRGAYQAELDRVQVWGLVTKSYATGRIRCLTPNEVLGSVMKGECSCLTLCLAGNQKYVCLVSHGLLTCTCLQAAKRPRQQQQCRLSQGFIHLSTSTTMCHVSTLAPCLLAFAACKHCNQQHADWVCCVYVRAAIVWTSSSDSNCSSCNNYNEDDDEDEL